MPPTTSCVRPARRAGSRAPAPRRRLAEDVAVERRPRCRRRAPSVAGRPRAPCGARSPRPTARGSPSVSSSTSGGRDLERRRPSCSRIARRCGEREARTAQPGSGKNRLGLALGRLVESEPWTMFWPTSSAKSPRIEPVAASSGLVAPITWRAAFTASSPSSTSATSGPPVMNSTSSPKNGLLVVLGVVLLGEIVGRPSCASAATIAGPCARSGR